MKAVSALTAAFRLVQLDSCGQSVEEACLREVGLMLLMLMLMSMLLMLMFNWIVVASLWRRPA